MSKFLTCLFIITLLFPTASLSNEALLETDPPTTISGSAKTKKDKKRKFKKRRHPKRSKLRKPHLGALLLTLAFVFSLIALGGAIWGLFSGLTLIYWLGTIFELVFGIIGAVFVILDKKNSTTKNNIWAALVAIATVLIHVGIALMWILTSAGIFSALLFNIPFILLFLIIAIIALLPPKVEED